MEAARRAVEEGSVKEGAVKEGAVMAGGMKDGAVKEGAGQKEAVHPAGRTWPDPDLGAAAAWRPFTFERPARAVGRSGRTENDAPIPAL